jgi:hypothetical protein
MDDPEWRLVIFVGDSPPASLLEDLASVVGDYPPRKPYGDSVSFYSPHEASARVGFDLAVSDVALSRARLDHFDVASREWLTVERSAMRHESATNRERRQFRIGWRPIALVVGLNVVGGIFLYYVPGMQFSPGAGDAHDLGRTIGMLLLANVVGGTMYAFASRRRA